MPKMGNGIYLVIAGTIFCYVLTFYLLMNKILNYLLSGRYTLFVFCIIGCALLFTIVPNLVFYKYEDNFDILSETMVVDNLSGFIIFILCISGVIIPVFLRNWLNSNLHLNQLKIKQEASKIEQLKEQINPSSFFKILNRSGTLIKHEPDKASNMLIKLSQLLRYQLYDCNRNEVLLSAEVNFLRNFLELEKLYSSEFNFSIITTGNLNGIFIPPSILLPYAQSIINSSEIAENPRTIEIEISNVNETIYIALKISGINKYVLQKELLKIKERLNILYKDNYKLTSEACKSSGQTVFNLTLNKK